MTRNARFALAFVLTILTAVPTLMAAPRRRAASPPEATAMTINGTVRDAATGNPVVGATVALGRDRIETDAQGKFTLEAQNGGSVTLTASRSGYETKQVTVTVGTAVEIRLTPLATTRVTLTNGQVLELDTDSLTFAYLVPLSGYAGGDTMSLCRNGADWQPKRGEIKRITGPGVMSTNGACCSAGQAMAVTVELKNGEKSLAYFKDSCQGYEVDIKARNHVTGLWAYLRYTEISEILFP